MVCAFSAAAALFALAARADKKPDPSGLDPTAISVAATRIAAFDRAHPLAQQFGKLTFIGGLVLTSSNGSFGGWSGLALDAAGRRLLAISDTGVWLTGELTYDGGRPQGITDARIGPLLGFDGKPLARRRDRDSEGIAVVSGALRQGEALISFEQIHRILRYPISDRGVGVPLEALAMPPETARLSPNKSLESVCQLKAGAAAGAIVTLAERFPSAGTDHVGWISKGAGWRVLRIKDIDDFYLTDCHGLPDGSMLVLERRYRWSDVLDGVRMRLRRFSPAEIASDAAMAGDVLIAADKSHEIDNMEGLAIHAGPDGSTIITMISDDNFNHVTQRTVLLQFLLAADPETHSGK